MTSLYDKSGVRVTPTWLEVADNRYPIREIDSITVLKATPPRTGPIACIILGFLGIPVYGLGLVGIISGVVWLLAQSSKHVIVLTTRGDSSQPGRFEVYRSEDINVVQEIHSALSKAIAQQ